MKTLERLMIMVEKGEIGRFREKVPTIVYQKIPLEKTKERYLHATVIIKTISEPKRLQEGLHIGVLIKYSK